MPENSFPISDLSDLLKIAQVAATKAGHYLVKKRGQAQVQWKKTIRDDLLDVDVEAEHLILDTLQKETPHLGILSEEAGVIGNQSAYWIVDPLDGSVNFQHGSPTFAIAIALRRMERTIAGVIFLPTHNEMFTALDGQGAYLNGQQIAVSQISDLPQAMIYMGDFTKGEDSPTVEAGLADFSKLVAQVQRIRMIGTAATDLAYVACGRADALINYSVHAWDTEAGKLLVTEAGGQAMTLPRHKGKPVSLYSNPLISPTLERMLF